MMIGKRLTNHIPPLLENKTKQTSKDFLCHYNTKCISYHGATGSDSCRHFKCIYYCFLFCRLYYIYTALLFDCAKLASASGFLNCLYYFLGCSSLYCLDGRYTSLLLISQTAQPNSAHPGNDASLDLYSPYDV